MRKVALENNEYYHIYNRGVDKRDIVTDCEDADRFILAMKEFNTQKPVGTLQKALSNPDRIYAGEREPFVDIIAYCLNPNHFHLLLHQRVETGISEYMRRFIGGYVRYFNDKKQRTGPLFGGRFKAAHVMTNEYLLHVASYINLNDKVHSLNKKQKMLVRSSWAEYMQRQINKDSICDTDIVLGQFKSIDKYKAFAESSLRISLQKKNYKNYAEILIEKK